MRFSLIVLTSVGRVCRIGLKGLSQSPKDNNGSRGNLDFYIRYVWVPR